MLSGLVNFIRCPAYNQSLLYKCGLQSLFAGGEWRWREILLPLPSPLSSPSVKTWPAGYKTTWNSILDCWMFRHMRMPNQLTYKGKKTRCTHQLKVRLYHIEIENWQCFTWILLTFWSLRCKFIKKRHCSYHKLNSKVKMCWDHLAAYAIFLSLYAKFEGSSVINKCKSNYQVVKALTARSQV